MRKTTETAIPQSVMPPYTPQAPADVITISSSDASIKALTAALTTLANRPLNIAAAPDRLPTLIESQAAAEFKRIRLELQTNFEAKFE